MAAPIQERPAVVDTQYQTTILEHYGATGEALGYGTDEVLAAMPESRVENSRAELSVGGMHFESTRKQVGVLLIDDCSRGGLEVSATATHDKVEGKAIAMFLKQLAAASEADIESGEPIDVGGKGGLRATAEELEAIGPEGRRELLRQHVEAHDINPHTNVTATDINTFGGDMDVIAKTLQPKYGNHAGAAASGVSREFGGEPELHFPRTGLGAAIGLRMYLEWRAEQGDQRVIEAMNGGRPLTLLQQAHGKAGSHFLANLPAYIKPKGLFERNGALVAMQSEFVDRDQLAELARTTGLSEASQREMPGTMWMPNTEAAKRTFWAMGADIVAPALDRLQFTKVDAEAFNGIATVGIANQPNTEEANRVLAAKEIDSLPYAAWNIGGTLSSRLIGQSILRGVRWDATEFEAAWRGNMESVIGTTLQTTTRLRQEQGRFVPIDTAFDSMVVDRAVRRLRAVS